MAEGIFYRGVASIPSRRSLNVQLGPTAGVGEDTQPVEQLSERQQTLAGMTTSLEPLNPGTTQRVTPRRRVQPRGQQGQLTQLEQQQQLLPQHQQHQLQQQQQQQQRIRWSRMSTSTAAMSGAPLSLTSMAIPTSSETSATGMCQLVDFGETRELIRRHREATKKLTEVNTIVTHLHLEKENSQQEPRAFIGWATFRRQVNSQFKQYVFQAPGQMPYLPAETDPGASQQHQQLQRSKTTLGLVAGRAAARHSRPEPLGAAFRRELTTLSGAAALADLRRESSNLSIPGAGLQQPQQSKLQFKGHGYSSNAVGDNSDSGVYGQYERRRIRTFHVE